MCSADSKQTSAYGLINVMANKPKPSSVSRDMHTYIPPQVQKAMTEQMQRTMPAHMQQYVGAYMEQNVMHSSQPQVKPASHRSFKPPTQGFDTHKMYKEFQQKQDDSQYQQAGNYGYDQNQSGQQFNQGQQNGNYDPNNPYGFILNPEQPKSSKFNFNASLPVKILAGLGLFLVVLIVGSILKGAIFGNGSIPESYVAVAQDQQAMIAILDSNDNQQNLKNSTQAFAITAQMSLSTSQSQLIKYMQLNKKKVSPKTLALKISPTTSKQLQDSIAASTYDSTFREIMKTKLNQYKQQLKATYVEATGQKGRALLDDSYNQADLLLIQLDATNS